MYKSSSIIFGSNEQKQTKKIRKSKQPETDKINMQMNDKLVKHTPNQTTTRTYNKTPKTPQKPNKQILNNRGRAQKDTENQRGRGDKEKQRKRG
jgi:hypothetical protein